MSFPEHFLTSLAQYTELSDREREVFLRLFGEGKSREKIAQDLSISSSAVNSCLTGIYKKFSIQSDQGRGKENALRDYLTQNFTHYRPKLEDHSPDELEQRLTQQVQELRQQIQPYIQERCSTMRVLDMEQPVQLTGEGGIYTNVNILEKVLGRRRLGIEELLQQCEVEDFDRFGLSRIQQRRVPGLKAVEQFAKLMVLGKPGAGKTTFLKFLAMQCSTGQFLADHVPFFVTLKEFAEAKDQPDLLSYLTSLFAESIPGATVDTILKQGKGFVLLDGLDEVRNEDTNRVLSEMQSIARRYGQSQMVITCRIAAKEYTFEQFTEVEVADFNHRQIQSFAHNWFIIKDEPERADLFWEKLEDNEAIRELASNPLLLTLLCLVFGEATDFPANRAELYEEGLDILLKKWDGKRRIERDQVYQKLSLKRKEDLLSQIACTTFKEKAYFIKQRILEDYIADYIQHLPDAKTDPEALHLDSEAVLKSIEAQHGLLVERAKSIYSFSHLTFQEYLTAREIAASGDLSALLTNLMEKRWREIVLLTAGMLRSVDSLLTQMKKQIDHLLLQDDKLQSFLTSVHEKSSAVNVPYKLAAVRAFYFACALALVLDLDLDLELDLALAIDRTLDQALDHALDLALTLTIALTLDFDQTLDYAASHDHALDFAIDRNRALDCALDRTLDRAQRINKNQLYQALQGLRDRFPNHLSSRNDKKQWWQMHGRIWVKDLRQVMVEYRNIGHDWQFTQDQKRLLEQYYEANKLLVDCLNSEIYVSRSVRQEIEESLLLPIAPLPVSE